MDFQQVNYELNENFEKKDFFELIKILDRIPETTEKIPKELKQTLVGLLQFNNGYVMSSLINAISRLNCKDAMDQIWECKCQRSILVRTAIAEASGDLEDYKNKPRLKKLLFDNDSIVRMFATISYAFLFPSEITPLYKKLLKTEKKDHVKSTLLGELFSVEGNEEYFDELLGILNSRSYHARVCASKTIVEVCYWEDFQIAIDALKKRLSKEKAVVVRCAVTKAIKELKELKEKSEKEPK